MFPRCFNNNYLPWGFGMYYISSKNWNSTDSYSSFYNEADEPKGVVKADVFVFLVADRKYGNITPI